MSRQPSSPLFDAIDDDLDTFHHRVDWAIKHRELCVFKDNDEVGVRVKAIEEEDDDDEIKFAQKKYEEKYEKAKKKLEEKKKKEEQEYEAKAIDAFFANNPALHRTLEIVKKVKPPIKSSKAVAKPTASSLKRYADAISVQSDDDSSFAVSSKQSKRRRTQADEGGRLYRPPCARCKQYGVQCHEQVPEAKQACYECNKGRHGCSFLNNPIHPRGANRGRVAKRKIEPQTASDEDVVDDKPRQVSEKDNHFVRAIEEQTKVMMDLTAAVAELDRRVGFCNEIVDIAIPDLCKIVDRYRQEHGEPVLGLEKNCGFIRQARIAGEEFREEMSRHCVTRVMKQESLKEAYENLEKQDSVHEIIDIDKDTENGNEQEEKEVDEMQLQGL